MDFKMADTSERRAFCNTILLKYHDIIGILSGKIKARWLILMELTCRSDRQEETGSGSTTLILIKLFIA